MISEGSRDTEDWIKMLIYSVFASKEWFFKYIKIYIVNSYLNCSAILQYNSISDQINIT